MNDPLKRETMLNLILECDRSCKELAGQPEVIDESIAEQLDTDKEENDEPAANQSKD